MNVDEEQVGPGEWEGSSWTTAATGLRKPTVLIPAVTAAGCLSSWIYLDGYLGFFGAQRHWFDLSLTRLLGHAWPAQATTVVVAVVVLWAADRIVRGAGSLTTALPSMFFIFFMWGTIEAWTLLKLAPTTTYEGPGTGILCLAAILGLSPILKPTSDLIGLFSSSRWDRIRGTAKRILLGVWLVALLLLLYLLPLRLGVMDAAGEYARVERQFRTFGPDATMSLVFSDGTTGLWIESLRGGTGQPLRVFVTGPLALGAPTRSYTAR